MKKVILILIAVVVIGFAAWWLLSSGKLAKSAAVNDADAAGYDELLAFIKSMPGSADYLRWWEADIALYMPGGQRDSYVNLDTYKVNGVTLKTGRLLAATAELNGGNVPAWTTSTYKGKTVNLAVFDKYNEIRNRIAASLIK